MNLYPNTRGSAARNPDKIVRVATHLKCLQILSDTIHPVYGVEHGMGNSSTPWFHGMNLEVLLSYEDDPRWRVCNPCKNTHVIVPYEGIDEFVEKVGTTIPDLQKTVCLVDGPGPQRIDVLVALIRLGAPGVVFHDAETLTSEEVARIKDVEKETGYFIRQHIGMNPETLLCSKTVLELGSDFVEF